MAPETGMIILVNDLGHEQTFVLRQASTTLGSADTNDIVIRQPRVARAHARIDAAELGYVILDLGSQRGTLVNDQAVSRARLAPGDRIQLGDAMLRFEMAADTTPADAGRAGAAGSHAEMGWPMTSPADLPHSAPGPISTITPIQTGAARPPLFVAVARLIDIPLVRTLASHLDAEQPVYVLHPPMTGASTTEFLASRYTEAMKGIQPTGPYAIAGHALAGIVVFEAARQLRAAGAEVALLMLLDTPYLTKGPVLDWTYRGTRALSQRLGAALAPVATLVPPAASETAGQALTMLKAQLRTRVPGVIDRLADEYDLMTGALADPAYAAILGAISSYTPRPYAGHVTLVLAADSIVRLSGALWGWHTAAPNGLDVHLVPGNTVSMLKEPNLAALVDLLRRLLSPSA